VQKKVLILTAGFGDGHNAAARSLRDAIELLDEDARTEVLDLFADSYGAFNTFARKTYLGIVQYAPKLWSGIYSLLENPLMEKQLGGFTRLQTTLEKVLAETQPDCVVSCYPVYAHVMKKIYRPRRAPVPFHHRRHRFHHRQLRVVSRAERFFLRGQRRDGGGVEKGRRAGKTNQGARLSRQPGFCKSELPELPPPVGDEPRRVLYIINTGKKKAGKAIDRLLELDDVHLTITAGRDPELRAATGRAHARCCRARESARLDEPDARTDDVAPSRHQQSRRRDRAGGHCRALPDDCQPGHSRPGGRQRGIDFARRPGRVAEKNREVAELVENAFADRASQWNEWRKNLKRVSRPDAALRIAELILDEAERDLSSRKAMRLFDAAPERVMRPAPSVNANGIISRKCCCAIFTFTRIIPTASFPCRRS
jgi:processive 1,2-diacylglycerol beta-glucosyltransferase